MRQGFAEVLRQPVIVENVPGAGGMTGAARVARAEPDGYTFLFGGESPNSQSPAGQQGAALRSRYRLRAGGLDGDPAAHSGRPRRYCRRQPAGFHRLRENQSEQDAVRLAGHRDRIASGLRAAQSRGRHRGYARAVSRARTGDAGSAGRPHRLSVSDDHDGDRADRQPSGAGNGGARARAFREPARRRHRPRAGAEGFRSL